MCIRDSDEDSGTPADVAAIVAQAGTAQVMTTLGNAAGGNR